MRAVTRDPFIGWRADAGRRVREPMRALEPITEHEVVAHFLKTEVHSVRFREELLGLLARDGLEPRIKIQGMAM